MSSAVIQTVSLGPQWPTADPFLFCAHHDDSYPSADGRNAPEASLAGRQLGQDFAGLDGWNMYHGRVVPGFPQHPHRGFETITFVRRGIVDHSDSLGATARFGRGDVQWMTAGSGIVHSEMFPLLDQDQPNPLQLFQVWLNLPSADKLVDPYFTMLWDHDIPKVDHVDADGKSTTVTVIAGALGDVQPAAGPPDSWASKPEADVAVWHIRMDPGARWTLPPASGADTARTLYLFDGPGVEIDDEVVPAATGASLAANQAVDLVASTGEIEMMLLQGRAIGEPVAQYGPIVMNTQDEVQQAFRDYQATEFGGWPWPSDDPVHTDASGRFAVHADGRREELPL